MTKNRMNVAGCGINVLRGGKGRPLLVLHGIEGGGEWAPYMEALAETHEVIAPEHPGFGDSDSPDWLESVLDLANFYQEFLDVLDVDSIDVVGSCLGGWVAMEMAVACSHRIASLTLAAPSGVQVRGVRKADLFIIPQPDAARLCFHDKELGDAAAARVAGAKDAQLDVQLKNRSTVARLAWQPYFYRPGLRNWLHRIRIPTQVLWGEDDRFLAPAHAQAIGALIPEARVSVLPACGHFPFIEKRESCVARVNDLTAERAR